MVLVSGCWCTDLAAYRKGLRFLVKICERLGSLNLWKVVSTTLKIRGFVTTFRQIFAESYLADGRIGA